MRANTAGRSRRLTVAAVFFISVIAFAVAGASVASAADRTPPTLSVTQPAEGATVAPGVVNVLFSATDASGIRSITCKLNTERLASKCASPKKYTITKLGNYSVTIVATDRYFNTTKVVRNFKVATPDTTPPAVTITSPLAGATLADNSVTAVFTASDPGTPASGVVGVACTLVGPDAQVISTGPCQSPATFSNLVDGIHALTVRATDAAGNQGSSTVSFTIAVPDTTPPVVTISSPTAGQVFTANTVSAEFSASDPGTPSSGVAQTNCRLVTGAGAVSFDGACQSPVQFTDLAAGQYSLTVEAIDGAGNPGASNVAFSVSIPDTLAPAIEISTPLANEEVQLTDGTLTATFSVADVAPPGGTPSGLASVTCWMNGAVSFGQSACSSPKTFSGVVPGDYVFVVRAVDNAGNTSFLDRRFTAQVCDDCVDLRITYPSLNGQVITHTNNPAFQFVANESSGQSMPTQCAVTAANVPATSFTACTSPWPAGSRPNGDYTLTVRATHSSGVQHTVTKNFSIAVSSDTQRPTVQITGVSSFGGSLSISWVASDNVGVTGTLCSMSVSGMVILDRFNCTSPTVYSGLPQGAMFTFRVSAYDAAGNVGQAQYSGILP